MAEKGSGKRFSHTKGKGSGKVMSKPSPESLDPSSPAPHIPHIKCQDNADALPKYYSALTRSANSELPPDDLEPIQSELEALLSTVALRYRVLKSELESSDSRRTKHLDRAPISPDKRRRGAPSSSGKPRKFSSGNSPLNHPPNKISKLKTSSVSPAPSQHTDDSSDVSLHNPKNLYHRNDTPNKFWLSIEPYTVPITQEDIRLLDGLLEEYSGTLAPQIPELGPHYTTQWGIEEHKEEQDVGHPQIKGKKTSNFQQNGDVMRVLRNSKKMGDGITGPFTQRLVSALMEENMIGDGHSTATATTTSTENSNSSLENIPNNTNMVHTRSAANLLKNGIAAERRIRKELIEQGILEAKDAVPSGERQDDVDEVLMEIQRVRSDLMAIAESNTSQLATLKEVALNEIKRLEIKKKLDDVDHEIIEHHKRIQLAKQKGRSLPKSERDEILRLTEKQKKLSHELDCLNVPGYTLSFLT
ncbi:CLUMA_CG015135, isoform A [Clunio marinus]|uniref:CLUMA_CG015135, isoform A n=1 Tax=Clunio marinus TaxID=568069 RepID=A0A1J1IU62_9DIPT|nr:CLUMA_CG015135, isoform A [Clunio marinus]